MLAWLSAVAKQGPLGSFCAAGFARQGLLTGGGAAWLGVGLGLGLGSGLGSGLGLGLRLGLGLGGGGSFALIAVRLEDEAAVSGGGGGLGYPGVPGGGIGLRFGSDMSELSSTEPSDHLRELSTQVVRFATGLSTEPSSE